MRRSELAEPMASTVDRIVSAREGTCTLDMAIEAIVDTTCRFNGRDATSFLEAYKAEIRMRDIPEDKQLPIFSRVVTPSIHVEVLEI